MEDAPPDSLSRDSSDDALSSLARDELSVSEQRDNLSSPASPVELQPDLSSPASRVAQQPDLLSPASRDAQQQDLLSPASRDAQQQDLLSPGGFSRSPQSFNSLDEAPSAVKRARIGDDLSPLPLVDAELAIMERVELLQELNERDQRHHVEMTMINVEAEKCERAAAAEGRNTAMAEALDAALDAERQHGIELAREQTALESARRIIVAQDMEIDRQARYITDLEEQLDEAQRRGARMAEELRDCQSTTLMDETRSELAGLLKKADGSLTSIDRALLRSFLVHAGQKNAPYKEQIVKDVALHFSNVLGMKEYLLLAEFWKLPKQTWVLGQRRELRRLVHLGTMHRQWDALSLSHKYNLFILVIDETRLIARLEGIIGEYGERIVGEAWPPDPLQHPDLRSLPDIPKNFEGLRAYVRERVEANQLAVNVEVSGQSYSLLCTFRSGLPICRCMLRHRSVLLNERGRRRSSREGRLHRGSHSGSMAAAPFLGDASQRRQRSQ